MEVEVVDHDYWPMNRMERSRWINGHGAHPWRRNLRPKSEAPAYPNQEAHFSVRSMANTVNNWGIRTRRG